MFFSLGISWGGLVMFGSYNKFHNKINIDASIVSSLDFFTSLIASVVIFSVLGHQVGLEELLCGFCIMYIKYRMPVSHDVYELSSCKTGGPSAVGLVGAYTPDFL